MKKSIKAALYSALVCPGVGHFAVRCPVRGLLLLLTTLLAAGFIMDNLMQQAFAVLERIQTHGGPPDLQIILDLVSSVHNNLYSDRLAIAVWIITGCWIIGIADSYREGAILDKALKQGNPG
jgi:hypothetical protein